MANIRIVALNCVLLSLLACASATDPSPEPLGGNAGAVAPRKPVESEPPGVVPLDEDPNSAVPPNEEPNSADQIAHSSDLPWPPTEDPPPSSGGETGSWTSSPCGGVSESVAVTLDAAAELGFSAREAADLLERGVDAPLSWTPSTAKAAWEKWQVSGYEPQTRVQAILHVTSIEHILPSPKYCDGKTCRLSSDHMPFDQATCLTHLLMHFTLALRTLDGALYVNTRGFLVMHGEDKGRPAAQLEVYGSAFSEVRGELKLIDDVRVHATALSVELVLKQDQISGVLRPTIVYAPPATPQLDVRSPLLSPQGRLQYGGTVPVVGEWPR